MEPVSSCLKREEDMYMRLRGNEYRKGGTPQLLQLIAVIDEPASQVEHIHSSISSGSVVWETSQSKLGNSIH